MAKKNTDETIVDVQEVYTKTELFVENNKKTLLGVLIAVAVIVLLIFAYQSFYKAPKNAKANEAIFMAESYFLMDSVETAVNGTPEWDGLEFIAEEYDGTAVGKRAHYMMGIYNRDFLGDFETALTHFKNADFGSPLLGTFVNGNIGDCLVEIGFELEQNDDTDAASSKYEEALPYFVKAANSSPDEITTQVYFKKAASVCLKTQNYRRAVEMYDGILDASTNVNSAEHKEAIRLRAMSSAKASQN